MNRTIRVAVVEDDQEIRDLLRRILSEDKMLEFVKSFPNGDEFLLKASALDVDVVIMDINMPGTNGIESVAQAKPLMPNTQFLISTVFENPTYIFDALCAGATGYILKSSSSKEILEAVHTIAEGGSPMSPAIARLVVASFQGKARERVQDELLTPREKEILDHLAAGLMYKQVAEAFGISTETVRKHVRNTYEKLQVTRKEEAIKKVFPGRP